MILNGKLARTHGPDAVFPKARTRPFHLLGHSGSLNRAQGIGGWVCNVIAARDVSKLYTCRAEFFQAKQPRNSSVSTDLT